MCKAALQDAIRGGNFVAKLTHLCSFWLDVSFFSHVKKHRSRFWLDVSFFSRVKTIVRSSDLLQLICVRKWLFGEYFSVFIYNKETFRSDRPKWPDRSKWTTFKAGPEYSGRTKPNWSVPFDVPTEIFKTLTSSIKTVNKADDLNVWRLNVFC